MKKKRSSKREWFDDDAFWEELYDCLFPPEAFAAAEIKAERLVNLIKPRGKHVLDLCCGPGRFAIPLARAGFAVTGVDRARYFLNRARSKARSAGVQLSLICRDMRDFVRPGAFDLAINMYSSFGYFEDRRDDLRVLQNIHASLKSGGVAVIDNVGKELLSRGNSRVLAHDLADGGKVIQEVRFVEEWTRAEQTWYLIRGDRVRTIRFRLNLYSASGMRALLEQAGFVDIQFHGNLKGAPYDGRAQRQITVGRKR